MVLNKFLPRAFVRASHIWKRSTNGLDLDEFGLRPTDVHSCRNGLLLCEPIEQAFDVKDVCFLYDPFQQYIYLKVLNPSLLDNDVSSREKFKDLDGKRLLYPEGNIPFRRLLNWHAKLSYANAQACGWIPNDEVIQNYFQLSEVASLPEVDVNELFLSLPRRKVSEDPIEEIEEDASERKKKKKKRKVSEDPIEEDAIEENKS